MLVKLVASTFEQQKSKECYFCICCINFFYTTCLKIVWQNANDYHYLTCIPFKRVPKMKSFLLVLIFLQLRIYFSYALILTQENFDGILTPENAVCLKPENIGPEKKFESEFTSTFVDPTNLINSVDLCKQLNFSILG